MYPNIRLKILKILCIAGFLCFPGFLYGTDNHAKHTETSGSEASKKINHISSLQNILVKSPEAYKKQADTLEINDPPLEKAQKLVSHVRGLQKKVTEENRKTKLLDPLVAYRLPLSISKQVVNTEQLVIIDSMVFSPDGNYINAAASIEYPSGDKEKLDFYGRKISFHRGGFIGNAKVELITEPEIKALNNNLDLVFKGDRGKTYVAFDCNGYKEMGVDLEISIPRSIALPVDKNGQIIDGKEKVSARAETVLTNWSELLIEASIPAFQVKGLKDFVFEVHLASFDLSDVANPSSLAFPDGYPEALSPLWRGFFCKEFSLTLPPYFESITGSVPAFSAQNLLIDMHGITGVFNAENLLAFDKGMNLIRMGARGGKK